MTTILVVDDSLTVRMDLAEALEAAGFTAIPVGTLADARTALRTGTIAMAILDVRLPDGNGVSLLEEIRTTPKLAQLPVILLSTEAEVKDRIRGLRTGANDYVGKPYDSSFVVARVRELTDRGRVATDRVVLVIDDSPTYRTTLADALTSAGYSPITASSGPDGLRLAAARRPSAILVDGVMPGMDGATVIRRIRLDPVLRTTPCVLLTGSEDEAAELRALDAGADAFVRKESDLDVILARVSAVLRAASGERPGAASTSLGPKRILAVDDSPTYLHELGDHLREEGYDVVLAASGEEAIELLVVQHVECILLDRLMPGMSGAETCVQIKSAPGLRDIPLIMLTAADGRDAMIDGLAAGADDFISKSSGLDVLKARVQAQIRRRQFEDEHRRIREQLLRSEHEAEEARAARELAETRAAMAKQLALTNAGLEAANREINARSRAIEVQNRELAQASRLKSEFLASMSHELRTPLNAIIGFSEALKDGLLGELQPDQLDYVTEVYQSGRHLLSLINDILDLSKIEAGKMELDVEAVPLEALVANAVTIMKERAAKGGVRMTRSLDPELQTIDADGRKLRQIVYNLLSNAVKFTPRGGAVDLAVTSHGPEVEISVVDTGIGIAKEDLPRLFRPFEQLDGGLDRKFEGTGLGLVMVRSLAELHGGTVGVESEPGKGSRFWVRLPRVGAGAQDDRRIDLEFARSARRPTTEIARVLVVDDDPAAISLARRWLEKEGFVVVGAQTCDAAWLEIQAHPPDAILLDILFENGPGGWEFLERLKDAAELATIPVVVVSIIADLERGLALGALEVLQKPVAGADLLRAIEALGLAPSASGPSPRVLVVDDDPRAVEHVAKRLEQAGMIVTRAYGGREALAAAAAEAFSAMVLDLMMPEVSGFDVVRQIRAAPATAELPIIIITAKVLEPSERALLERSVHAVLSKEGWSANTFLQVIRGAIHVAQQATSARGGDPGPASRDRH